MFVKGKRKMNKKPMELVKIENKGLPSKQVEGKLYNVKITINEKQKNSWI